MLKRAIDLAVVSVTAPLWVPLLGLVAILVRLKLGRPVFFRQGRPGKNEKLFEMIKFRTMANSCDVQGKLLPDTLRLSPFGKFLRSTSLDELPELLNVLKGDMSLVGPRPLLARYLDRYSPRQRRRHEVRPGITGLAQVKGRNALSWEEKFEWDLRYVESQSLWLDLKILLITLKTVVVREGISAHGEATMSEFQGRGGAESYKVGGDAAI